MAMIMSAPASVVIWAARSLVAMPPVPSWVPLPPPSARMAGVISSTIGMREAVLSLRGSAVYSPSMSLSRMSSSAPISRATMAARVSLSPMTISSVATVSFSLMTGSAPMASSRNRVLRKCWRRSA